MYFSKDSFFAPDLLWNNSLKLGLCGDYFGGPRLENGWLSAQDLFKKI